MSPMHGANMKIISHSQFLQECIEKKCTTVYVKPEDDLIASRNMQLNYVCNKQVLPLTVNYWFLRTHNATGSNALT
jgi:hypothetical protein